MSSTSTASPHVETVLAWADSIRRAKVLADAGSPRLAQVGVSFGADGVLAAAGADVQAMVAAAGTLPVWLVATGEPEARAALAGLRPGLDVLVTGAWRALQSDAAARGVTLGAAVSIDADVPELDALVIDVPDASAVDRLRGLALPARARVVLRGEAATRADALSSLGERALFIAVPPLDVPGGRLCAARAV